MADNNYPEKNALIASLPKAQVSDVQKIANNVTANSAKRRDSVKLQQAAQTKVINPSMYDQKIEKLQSYGSKWDNYGYNPNIDNESFYDKITSDSEQWMRSIKGAGKLAAIGFNDSVLFGAFSNSKKNANEFGKIADMYSTQRGGVTGFAQNLTLNAGYTMGITADMLLEEAALFGLSAIGALPSGGTSLVAGGSAMVAKGIKAFGQIGKAFDKMNDLKRVINAVDKVNDISKGRKALNAVGNVLNPFEHSTKYIQALKNVSSVKDLSSLGKLVEGGAAVYRDVKAGQMAVSEAKLEANMLEKDMYDEFLLKNPNPSAAQMKDFEKNVKDAKFYTMMENTGAIFATNKLVFNNMYKRFDDLKGIGKFVSTGKFGKLAVSGGETTVVRSGNIFQKGFYQGIKDQSKLLFDKGALTALGRIGTSAGSKLGKYGVSNLGEGLQETLQETIQAKNKYQFGNEASGGYFDALLHGLKEQGNKQGLETFASGFLMGGLVNPVTATVTKPLEFFKNKDYKQFTDKQTFNTERERKLHELKQDSDLINEGFKNVGNVYNSMGNTLAAQQRIEKEMVDAVAEGDRHLFQDKKDESFRTHLHTMMKHGMLDEFIKHTDGFKNMDPKQAAAAFGIDENTSPDVINKLINKKIEQAKNFKNRYTKFKQDFQSPVNVSKLKPTDDNYLEQINFHHHWNKAVDDMIFDTAEFEQNLDRKIELLDTVKNDAQQYGVSYTDYNVLTSDAEMNKEINSLNKEIAVLSGYDNLTSEGKEELKQKNYKLKALIKYQEALGEHNRVLSKIEELTSQPNLNKKQKSELKRLNAHLKRSADRMESRHGSYLKIVHTGEYETPGEKPTGLPKKTRLDHFSKRSFEKLYDYYKLDNRNKNLEQSIDLLSDPSYLQEHVNRMNKLSDVIMESHKAFVRNSISKFRDKEETNKVVKELLDAGVSFDLSELDELIEKGIMPKAFYDIETEEELKQSDPKFKLAQQKLNNLIDNLIEQPILEREKDIYREVGRGVRINDGDKRTYNEIAKEYGFDVENERPVSEVLDVIINSKSATKQEKELAKILKNLIPADSKVVFVDNSGRPNKFQKGKSIIDARYAASNFTNSVFSIEELILKNELERLTTDALKNDPVFNAEVKALKEATIEYVKDHNEKNKDDESKQIKTSWKAFDSELDFIKESFGNQSFQTLLTRVPAPKKETTTWQSLIDSMVDVLNKLLGKSGNVSATVYNSIVSVVQAKIDPSTLETPQQDDSLVEQEEEITTTPVSEEVEDLPVVDEDYADFDENKISTYPKVLLSKLIEAYRSDVEKGDAIGKDANKLSETNLTKEFKSWVDDSGQSIIENYRIENEKPISDNIEVIDVDNKEVLIGRGFTEEQINAMSAAELEKAVKENTMPSEVSSEELVVNELINEVTISEDEKVSEEEIPTDTTGEGASSTVSPTTTEEEVSNKQITESSIEAKRVVAQSKIKRTDLFDGVGEFSTELGGSDLAAVPISHKEINGIEFVEYAHPKTGSVDVIVTGKSNNDFVGFYRIYENGKPTNKWSSKFENQSRNKQDFKTMISGVQGLLPIEHEYTEKTSISTDGLRVWNQQLNKGYELQYDEKRNIKTNRVAINGDAIVNELGIPVNKGNFENIKVYSEEQFNIVKEKLLPYLTSLGLTEKNIHWATGTVKIDLPILKKSSSVVQKTTAEQISNAFEELAKSVGEGVATKMQQYADRIKAGEPKEKVLEGVSKSFVDGVNALLGETTPVKKEAPTTPDEVNNIKILLSLTEKANGEPQRYVSRKIMELAHANDPTEGGSNANQSLDTIIRRGGYAQYELDKYLPGWRDMLELPGEKTTAEQPVGRNQSMHEKLVSELESNKTVTGNIVAKGSGNKSFVLEINGEKAIFYDYNNEVSASDLNKKVTLKLVPELKVEGKAEPFKNVIQVYDGERFLGNVAITDYDASEKITVPTEPTDEELQSIAEEIVDKNEEVFATPESILSELGYTKSDITKLSKANKMRIIKDQISKEQFVKEQAELKKLKQENKIQGEITNFLSDKFTGLKTEKELLGLYDKLIDHLNQKSKVTLQEINDIHLPFIQNLFNQARLDLSNQKDFSTLSVGDKLLLTDGRIVKVKTVNQKTNTIEVVDFNSIIENKTKLTAKQFDSNVKKVINDFNLKQDEIASALDQNNLDDLSSILSKFTTQSFAIADEDVTDEDILEHFKACK